MVKTLAQLKRDLKVGSVVKMIKREVNGKEGGIVEGERTITIVQTNSIAFETLKNGKITNSWLYFPKASQVEYINNIFTFNDGYFKLTYEIVKQ